MKEWPVSTVPQKPKPPKPKWAGRKWWTEKRRRVPIPKELPRYKILVGYGSSGSERVVRVVDTWQESGNMRWGQQTTAKRSLSYLAAAWGTVRKWVAKGDEGRRVALAEAGALAMLLNKEEKEKEKENGRQ